MSPSRISEVSAATVIEVLESLITTGSFADSAEELEMERETVLAVGREHGFPNAEVMGRVVDRLKTEQADTVAEAQQRAAGSVQAVPAVPTTLPTDGVWGATVLNLVSDGKRSTVPSTVKLAKRVEQDLALLHSTVRQEKADAEALAEIARLEAQLAERRAALGAGKPSRSPGSGESKRIRQWALAQGFAVRERGVIAQDIRDKYTLAHAQPEA